MITLTTEPGRKLIRIKMGGMLTVEEIRAFSTEQQRVATNMRAASGEFDLLVEAIGTVVQTQEVTDALAALMLNSPVKSGKIAVVREGALTRIQTKRIGQRRSNYEVFSSMADAEAWLAER